MKTDHLHQTRMRDIETLLLWEGEVGNARVRQLYELSMVRASQLIAEYRRLNPNGVEWDSKARLYRRANGFRPLYQPHPMDDYDQLVSGHTPPFIVDARPEFTRVDPNLFAKLYQACAEGGALLIRYRSMGNPDGSERVIQPQNLVRVGRRWHVRAWCRLREDYRDFAVGRMASAAPVEVPSQPPRLDADWDAEVDLHVAAHRALGPAQQAVIRAEYFDGAVERRMRVRRCLAKYVVQDLRAAVDPERQVPPEFQLEISNADQDPKLFLNRD